ncbi:MAG: translation initiation factor IF-2 [Thermoguttaceae bacterium]
MPIRIYALAKQLKLDSKVLADICTKAGITGKGSALASLSDDEVTKVNAYIEAGKSKRTAASALGDPSAAEASVSKNFRREDYIAPTAASGGGEKIRVLDAKPKKKAPQPRETAKPEVVAEAPSDAQEPVAPVAPGISVEPVELAESVEPAEPVKPIEPAEPVRPAVEPSRFSKLKNLILSKKAAKSGKVVQPEKPDKQAPSIKLAPMPTAKMPPKKAKADEPAPQKPDIRLPPDAIRASAAGTEPLSEHLRKHEKKKAQADKKKSAKPKTSGEAKSLGEMPTSTPERGRRGARTGEGTEKGKMALGGREARQLKRKRGTGARRGRGKDDERPMTRRRTRIRRTGTNTAAPRKTNVVVELPCTVRTFSEAIGVSASTVVGELMKLGTMANINANLDAELAELLAEAMDVEVDFRRPVALEDKLLQELQQEDAPETLEPRPPIVTFLGHVDHGKTSLLDRIIGIDVVSGEKGGITQHIRAYRVEKEGRSIAFVDTPGHEAFTEMRARGANVTDIAVLVVAADDGVMPQTEEAISHARAAGVPIVVALNKIDLPGVTTERSFQQLAENDLLPSEWGGDVEVIKTSAATGEGIDELLDTLLTVAELHEYSANPNRPGIGTCIEVELHEGRGVVAKLLTQRGTLHVGDIIVCGAAYGRIKAMYDTLDMNKRHKEAGPSMPVNVTGLNIPPGAGDHFYVLDDISAARHLAEQRAAEAREKHLVGGRPHVTLENLFERLGEAEIQTLNIILRADVRGSIEAIQKELTKLEHPEVQIKILQASVGGITEADVHLADASDAVIIGFSVVPDEGARSLADERGVQIRRYDIIYQVTEDLRDALEGMLKPEKQEKDLGRALVQRIFQISRLGSIAGCRVLAGTIERDARIRVIRESRVIGDYKLDSLRRVKDDVRDVREGFECGIKLVGFNDLKEGDVLEAYKIEEIRRTFESEVTV